MTPEQFAQEIGKGLAAALLGQRPVAVAKKRARKKKIGVTKGQLPLGIGDLPTDDDLRAGAGNDAYSLETPLTLEAIERLAREARSPVAKAREEAELRERLGVADRKIEEPPSIDVPSVPE